MILSIIVINTSTPKDNIKAEGNFIFSASLSRPRSSTTSIVNTAAALIVRSLRSRKKSPQENNVTIGAPNVRTVDTPLYILYFPTSFIAYLSTSESVAFTIALTCLIVLRTVSAFSLRSSSVFCCTFSSSLAISAAAFIV